VTENITFWVDRRGRAQRLGSVGAVLEHNGLFDEAVCRAVLKTVQAVMNWKTLGVQATQKVPPGGLQRPLKHFEPMMESTGRKLLIWLRRCTASRF
jgi:hypothetical protein